MWGSVLGGLSVLYLMYRLGRSTPSNAPTEVVEKGVASWYGPGFEGRLTANGERFDSSQMTAAHKTLRFGTVVDVRRTDTGAEVRVRINDRGPFVSGRIIDLSRAAGGALDMLDSGVAPVEVRVVSTSK